MATVFWDFHDVVFINYLKKRKNGEYYAALLDTE